MATYKFDDEDSLGKAVQSVKPFCKLTKKMDMPDEKTIVGDFAQPEKYPGLAGKKWSRLCGFTFKAKDGRLFQFVYVPKLKGTLSRNQKALSGWYCWSLSPQDKDNKEVTSISEMKSRYGFDINKFVHSDFFDKCIKLFKENISFALENQVKDLVAMPSDSFEDYQELVRHVNAVKDSMSKISDVKQFVTPETKQNDDDVPDYAKGAAPKVGHAKIAYNADKTYSLRNLGKQSQEDELARRAAKQIAQKLNATPKEETPKATREPKKSQQPKPQKQHVKFDPALKHKFGGGRARKSDAEIFDKYDDYDNDDFR